MTIPEPDVPASGTDSVAPAPTDARPADVADLAALESSARPARLRRAPRYGAFFWTGALVGIVVGIALGVWVSDPGMINRWIYVLVVVLSTTLVTTLVAGLLAILADRRSTGRSTR
ncbi:hypothetical protein [Sanguibacter antarcticus]|uniref:Uncharacterized protein n=1 Tax=Sanguibacter antarcticus TaxID=372484 RepID=A0A2A9E8D9_9MICO|nr:hypothetical protein [Sanguibacter antarcticus]PFG35103.1 hypothetical protein ATL42_3037 [Sanguibacter antarcticus]